MAAGTDTDAWVTTKLCDKGTANNKLSFLTEVLLTAKQRRNRQAFQKNLGRPMRVGEGKGES